MTLNKYPSNQDRLQKSLIFQDNKENRKELILRSREILDKFLILLGSNYQSQILGPNYTLLLNAIALESARIRLTSENILSDNFYKETRSEFLYRNLGYLIHGQDLKFNTPKNFSDKKYREFLLGILSSLLKGSTPESIEEGGKIFLNNSVKVVELFLQALKNGEIDLENQFIWRLDVEVNDQFDSSIYKIDEVKKGLTYFAEIIKPAHTLFDVRFIYTENLRIGQDGCQQILDVNGYFKAGSILLNPNIISTKKGINDDKVIGIIEKIDKDFIYIGSIPIKVPFTTKITDAYGTKLKLKDLRVGLGVEINGILISPLLFQGFPFKQKNNNTEICDSYKLTDTNYFYDDKRKCSEQFKKIYTFVKEKIYNPLVPGNKKFHIKNSPIVKNSLPITLADASSDIIVYVNGFEVEIEKVLPLEGSFILKTAPPNNAIIEVSYSYYPDPVIPFTLNSFGSTFNAWGLDIIDNLTIDYDETISNQNIYNGPPTGLRYKVYLTSLDDKLDESFCDPQKRKIDWEGFEKTYSTLFNSRTTFLLNQWESSNPNYHKLNSSHILSNIGPKGTKIGGLNPDYNDWTPRKDLEEDLNYPTPSFNETRMMKGWGDNFNFKDQNNLNSKNAKVNESIELNNAEIIIEENPLKNQLAIQIEENNSGNDKGALKPAIANLASFKLEGDEYSEEYHLNADEDQNFLLNYWPIKAIAQSPVTAFEIDFEEQEKHSFGFGKLGFVHSQNNLSQVNSSQKFNEFISTDEIDESHSSNQNIIEQDSFLFESNNFLLLNSYEVIEQILPDQSDIKDFLLPDPGYINSEFESNNEESELNADSSLIGQTEPTVIYQLNPNSTQGFNDFNFTLPSFRSKTGGWVDELVLVEMDGGNPWLSITKLTEDIE